MTALIFYAPTFLDESLTYPDKHGNKRQTGRLSGMVFARRFSKAKSGKLKAQRLIIPFAWDRDTQEAKAEALAKAIEGMAGELPELDTNPPLNFIPEQVKEKLS